MSLHRDFEEFLRALHSHEVRYLVVGAHALAVHGAPRYTHDLDVFVQPTKANARRLVAALGDFGFGAAGVTVDDFTTSDRVVQLGVAPVRIDILTGIAGVSFAEAWRGRLTTRLNDLELPVLGLAEYVKNKKAAGRPKDTADLALLEEARAVSPPGRPSPRPERSGARRRRR